MEPYLPIEGFDVDVWLSNPMNVTLTDGEGNFSLFEKEKEKGLYTGHYFFKDRGKKALSVCRQMLEEIFKGPYGATVIRGMTPVEHLGALRMNKWLGFKEYGVVEGPTGRLQTVVLTKKEWEGS